MAVKKRPTMQNQGPDWRCKLNGKMLGWVSCTAYSMAMGIDASTVGSKKPKGCEVRKHTNDVVSGLTLSQVASVAAEKYGVRVTVRTGSRAIAPDKAWEQISKGRGFVLQGNCDALVNTPFRSTKGAVNHAVWVNRVRGGTPGHPKREARVFDPAADGRNAPWGKAVKGPSWWPWETLLAFGANLRGDSGQKIGPGKLYAGFVPKPPPAAQIGPEAAPGRQEDDAVPGPTAGEPAGEQAGQRAQRARAASIPNMIVDRLSDGMLFVAYQRFDTGAAPGGSSKVWYGNEDGTSGSTRVACGRSPVSTARRPGAAIIAVDFDIEDIVIGAEFLQADIFGGNLAPEEFTFAQHRGSTRTRPSPRRATTSTATTKRTRSTTRLGWGRA